MSCASRSAKSGGCSGGLRRVVKATGLTSHGLRDGRSLHFLHGREPLLDSNVGLSWEKLVKSPSPSVLLQKYVPTPRRAMRANALRTILGPWLTASSRKRRRRLRHPHTILQPRGLQLESKVQLCWPCAMWRAPRPESQAPMPDAGSAISVAPLLRLGIGSSNALAKSRACSGLPVAPRRA